MLKRQDLSAAEQAAAVVDQLIIDSFEHIDIDSSQIEFLKPYQSFIRFIKTFALACGNQITL